MAIQVPKISVNPQDTQEHAPRLDSPHIDPVAPMAQDLGAMEGVAKDAIRLHNEIAHQQADNMATNAANEFLIWRKKRLYGDGENWAGYANMTGANPHELYKQFDKEQDDKLDELSKPKDGNADWSTETQNLVNRRLSRHYEETQLETLTQQSRQQNKWDDNVKDTHVALAQQGMYPASAQIVPGDESSFGPMQAKIASIRNAIIGRAMGTRGAVEDENGSTVYNDGLTKKTVTLTKSTEYEIAKAVSDGLGDATKNLVDSKALDKAKALKDWADQNGFLDIMSKGNLEDKLEKAQFKKDAADHADEAMRHGGMGYLDSIKDPEMRLAAKKLVDEEQRYNERDTNRKQKNNYDAAAKQVDKVMNSGNPYKGVQDMQNDPEVAKVWSDMSSKQQQALEHRASAPKETSAAVQSTWLNLVSGKLSNENGPVKLNGMDVPTLMQYTSGMKPADQKAAMATWQKMNTQTGAQTEQQYNQVGKEFDQQAIGARLFRNIPNTKLLVPEDAVKNALYKKELMDSLDAQGPMSHQERSDYVAKFIADKVANQAFTPPSRQKMNGGGSPPAASPPGATPPPVQETSKTDVAQVYGKLNEQQRMSYIMAYKKENAVNGKSAPAPNEQQLIEFITKKMNKGH